MDDTTLAVSALQHYAYCPRQFALIHVEQAWMENRFTAEGQLLHQRVDSGMAETRGAVRSERGVLLRSEKLGLSGKMDLLEIHKTEPPTYLPVEYKRGKPKVEAWDRIQLCAQALCLEEMRNIHINKGAIWYWETRKRIHVELDEELRAVTLSNIRQAREILRQGLTPRPIDDKKRCRACSLVDLCQPEIYRRDHSLDYVEKIYRDGSAP